MKTYKSSFGRNEMPLLLKACLDLEYDQALWVTFMAIGCHGKWMYSDMGFGFHDNKIIG